MSSYLRNTTLVTPAPETSELQIAQLEENQKFTIDIGSRSKPAVKHRLHMRSMP